MFPSLACRAIPKTLWFPLLTKSLLRRWSQSVRTTRLHVRPSELSVGLVLDFLRDYLNPHVPAFSPRFVARGE